MGAGIMVTLRQPHPHPYQPYREQWEYKIVRARNGEFGDRAHLRALLRQEGRAGWIMIEKYDDYQVRFKRPCSARRLDDQLPPEIDPYRTIYHFSREMDVIYAVLLAAALCFVILAMVILVVVVSPK
jgi:hypothetical protein